MYIFTFLHIYKFTYLHIYIFTYTFNTYLHMYHSVRDWGPLSVLRTDTPIHRYTDTPIHRYTARAPIHRYTDLGLGFGLGFV